ncbi:MAG: DnaT-like ssDNA-binding protein, partial [Pseudomonadota bacterium]
TLTVENGTGVEGADSYASRAFITSYWQARPQNALAATWAAAEADEMDGAAREATAYVDANYGAYFPGVRAGYVQGLMWPRSDALDDRGYALPRVPPQLLDAVAELAARALSASLSTDTALHGAITKQSVKVDVISETTEYGEGARLEPKYGAVDGILAPILNGAQPGAAPTWNWR